MAAIQAACAANIPSHSPSKLKPPFKDVEATIDLKLDESENIHNLELLRLKVVLHIVQEQFKSKFSTLLHSNTFCDLYFLPRPHDRGGRSPQATSSTEFEAELESRPREANASNRSTMQKMPSETEREEFFAAAEKDLQKQFTDK
ncbi:putative cyclin-dependent kinase inhibitor 7-like [Forsythia ovata]|uniref:Cyclin-dependent kinase inhibitor 7-like n=1 Tax=Forsythia ovata TaxID=205694 RepID=A0ABD1NXF9_9LAMI